MPCSLPAFSCCRMALGALETSSSPSRHPKTMALELHPDPWCRLSGVEVKEVSTSLRFLSLEPVFDPGGPCVGSKTEGLNRSPFSSRGDETQIKPLVHWPLMSFNKYQDMQLPKSPFKRSFHAKANTLWGPGAPRDPAPCHSR